MFEESVVYVGINSNWADGHSPHDLMQHLLEAELPIMTQVVEAKMKREKISAAVLAPLSAKLKKYFSHHDDFAPFDVGIREVIRCMCDAVHAYNAACVQRRFMFLLCLKRMGQCKDMRLLLMRQLIKTEDHEQRFMEMLSFCKRQLLPVRGHGAQTIDDVFEMDNKYMDLFDRASGYWNRIK
jgi:hypothetical protein